jgi:Orotidine 5'-phosphate decarboxylase / HUMPS family
MDSFSGLSDKLIPAHERLIFALDFDTADDAKKLVEDLGENVHFYKLGLQLFMSGSYRELVAAMAAAGVIILFWPEAFTLAGLIPGVTRTISRLMARQSALPWPLSVQRMPRAIYCHSRHRISSSAGR